MRADVDTAEAIRRLVERTYAAMSAPGGDLAGIFGAKEITVAGSGQGELMHGPEQVVGVARAIATQGLLWVPVEVTVWRQSDVAWAQILGHVEKVGADGPEQVPYWTTGVFVVGPDDEWQWVYWGGAEPQEHPRV